jgi:sec-independent protein translocase protein TatB
MLSLSPAKLLVILVIALIVLGPEKLPQVARQLGAAWHDLRKWRTRIETEVRGTFPNLPPPHEVAQAVRSPFAFLDRLADEHERATTADAAEGAGEGTAPSSPSSPSSTGPPAGPGVPSGNGLAASAGGGPPGGRFSGNGSAAAVGPGASAAVPGAPVVPDDPSMN